ncbi:beta-amylase 3, chloroplastic-like [Senna tora]|uniref:Beta-amylase n=1 Tax=Senna tora TaxID=362788 RepID=A0A834WQJ5_9FABA|nr:beta-amylase 3, chloroplastic-like [Senna tora]
MAIASPSTPSFSASFCSTRTQLIRLTRFPSVNLSQFRRNQAHSLTRRLVVTSRLNSSKSPDAGGSVSPDNGDFPYELQHDFAPQRQRSGSPVFITLPVHAVDREGRILKPKAMTVSFRTLATAGVEGVVFEIWWGLVEGNEPRVYSWRGYLELVKLAQTFGLKVRVVLAFHQFGTGPDDPNWIPLPQWVRNEIEKDRGLVYSDKSGKINAEYISLGCDVLPVLCGRSPIQAYADFMRDFRDTFRPYLGIIITGVQIGMGPGSELRYPLCPSYLLRAWPPEHGKFQCYDKVGRKLYFWLVELYLMLYVLWGILAISYWLALWNCTIIVIFNFHLFFLAICQYMLASLNAYARETGMPELGYGALRDAEDLVHGKAVRTSSLRREDDSWSLPHGEFFLEWYSGMLLLHGERICREAETIFRGTEVKLSAKVAAIHWHYKMDFHPSELRAGYYNTKNRNGYLPIARMFSKYGFGMCCSCFEMNDAIEYRINPDGSPEGLLRQLLLAARLYDIPLEGQNYSSNLNNIAFEQVLEMSKYYSDGIEKRPFSFNLVRMEAKMFDSRFWIPFTHFVRQMSGGNTFRARLNSVAEVRTEAIKACIVDFVLSFLLMPITSSSIYSGFSIESPHLRGGRVHTLRIMVDLVPQSNEMKGRQLMKVDTDDYKSDPNNKNDKGKGKPHDDGN